MGRTPFPRLKHISPSSSLIIPGAVGVACAPVVALAAILVVLRTDAARMKAALGWLELLVLLVLLCRRVLVPAVAVAAAAAVVRWEKHPRRRKAKHDGRRTPRPPWGICWVG